MNLFFHCRKSIKIQTSGKLRGDHLAESVGLTPVFGAAVVKSCAWSIQSEDLNVSFCLWHPRLPKRWDAEMIWKIFNGGRYIHKIQESLWFSLTDSETSKVSLSSLEMQKAQQLWWSMSLIDVRIKWFIILFAPSMHHKSQYSKLCCVILVRNEKWVMSSEMSSVFKLKRQNWSFCLQRN